jgi:predicted 2-oxoglutarate/Fe(II)-dependent dioxygenase YbiX
MKIHICNDNKVFPFLYVDDWYTPEEEKLIWKELDFYSNPTTMHRTEDANEADGKGAAKNKDGTSKNKAWRLYLDTTYAQREVSHILRLQLLKMSSDKIQDAIEETGPNFRLYRSTNYDEMLVNYYEDGDHYESHFDQFMLTVICWFYRTPKSYTGGDLTFTDTDVTLECNHNRMVMFPSYYLHAVQPIKMEGQFDVMGWGRYAIENFYCKAIR